MDRRKFLIDSCKSCALAGAGLLLGSTLLDSCATAGLAIVKAKEENGSVRLPVTDFSDNKIKLVRVNNYAYDIAIRQLNDGSYLALLLKCTHAGQPLTKAGNGFYCTLHGSQFNADGLVKKGPASHPLVHLPVTVANSYLIISLNNAPKI